MFEHILVPVDLNAETSWKRALPVALRLAQDYGSTLHVMTVLPTFGMSMVAQYFPADYEARVTRESNERLHALVKEMVPEGVKVQHVIAEGTIYEEILKTARTIKADLIVMASHRPELQDYLLGPNAARVTRHANCSVMVVRD